MRRALGLGLVGLLCATLAAAAEPEGYGDLRWGDAAPKRWQRRHASDPEWVHAVRGRGGTFGAVPLEGADYEFSGGTLSGVVLIYRDRAAFLGLRAELEAAFGRAGEPAAARPASESLCWRGSATWAYLDYLGEGVTGLLWLARAPVAETPEAAARAAQERALMNRVRLYDHLDAVLSRSLQAIGGEVAWVDRSLQESQPTSVKCRDLQVDREQDQQREQRNRRDLLSSQDAVAAERGRLGQEAAAARAELEALRKR